MQTPDTVKIVRSVPSLANLVGTEAPFQELVAIMREDMRRPLSSAECSDYSGIRHVDPWKMFTQLYNIKTAEELIVAEENSAFFEPADYPGQVYMFACERGLVAAVAPNMLPQLLEQGRDRSIAARMLDELHQEYKAMSMTAGKDWDREMQEIAEDYVKWACRDRTVAEGTAKL